MVNIGPGVTRLPIETRNRAKSQPATQEYHKKCITAMCPNWCNQPQLAGGSAARKVARTWVRRARIGRRRVSPAPKFAGKPGFGPRAVLAELGVVLAATLGARGMSHHPTPNRDRPSSGGFRKRPPLRTFGRCSKRICTARSSKQTRQTQPRPRRRSTHRVLRAATTPRRSALFSRCVRSTQQLATLGSVHLCS